MNKGLIYFLLACCLSLPALAQPIDEPYRREIIVGLNVNTNGGIIGGVNGRLARFKKNNVYETFGIEIVNVKHQKEERIASPVTGNTYVYGKVNYLFSFRAQYGRNFVLFNKAPEDGIEVNAVIAGGPTFGLVKPYMIEYDYFDRSQIEAYDPSEHGDYNRILGNGNLFSGMDDAKIVPGLNLKTGLSFEFGSYLGNVSGVEIGFLTEVFPKKIILVNDVQNAVRNKALFTSLYLTLYYGRRD